MFRNIILILIINLYIKNIFAHVANDSNAPPPDLQESYLSYGSYGATSDAEARSLLAPNCRDENLRDILKCLSSFTDTELSVMTLTELKEQLDRYDDQNFPQRFADKIREKILEKNLLEQLSYEEDFKKPKTENLPSCLKKNKNAKKMFEIYQKSFRYPSNNSVSNFIRNPNYGNLTRMPPGSSEREIANRFQNVQDQNTNAKLIQFFGKAMKTKGLFMEEQQSGQPFFWTDDEDWCGKNPTCAPSKELLGELENNFPVFFNEGLENETSANLYKSLNFLVNNTVPKADLPKEVRESKNPNLSLYYYLKDSEEKSTVPKLSKLLMDAKKISQKPKKTRKERKISEAFGNFDKIFSDYRKGFSKNNNKRLENLCPNSALSKMESSLDVNTNQILNDFLKNNRLEVQQAIIELSKNEKDKNLINRFLCKETEQPKLNVKQSKISEESTKPACEGVTRTSDGVSIKKVKIDMTNPVLGSQVDYSIKSGKPPVIKYKVKIAKGNGVSDKQLNDWKERMREGIANRFNCGSGAITSYIDDSGVLKTCPQSNSKTLAKFEIDIEEVKSGEEPSFIISECQHSGVIEDKECKPDLKKGLIEDCMKKGREGQLPPQKSTTGSKTLSTLFPTRTHFSPLNREKTLSQNYSLAQKCMKEIENVHCTELADCDKVRCLWKTCGRVSNEPSCFNDEILKLYCERRFIYRSREDGPLTSDPLGLREPPPLSDIAWQRANSLRLPLAANSYALSHEIGHKLGLEDEYFDRVTLDYPNFGENDSLMRSGDNLKRRHIEQILSPLSCL